MINAYRQYAEGGYADKRTVLQGESITFYIASSLPNVTVTVVRQTDQPGGEVRLVIPGLVPNPYDSISACTPSQGCRWEPTYVLDVPTDWPSGYYTAEFPVQGTSQVRSIHFVVAEAAPGSTANVLYVLDMSLGQAYNVWGGASLYGCFDSSGVWKDTVPDRVSSLRPMLRSHTQSPGGPIDPPYSTPHQDEVFRRWLSARHELAYASNDSMEMLERRFGGRFLDSYPLVVVTGSQEYISHELLDLLQRYVERGGHLYLSTTEFAFWIVRFESDGDAMVVYKTDPRRDPLSARFPDRVAALGDVVRNIEDDFGVALSHGIGINTGFGGSPILVLDPDHWALAGSGLSAGADLTIANKWLSPGAWIDGHPLKIVSADIPPIHQEIIAAGAMPALIAPSWVDLDIRIDGVQNKTFPRDLPSDTVTSPVVAVLHVGAGTILVDSGIYYRAPYDPPVAGMIERVFERWGVPAQSASHE